MAKNKAKEPLPFECGVVLYTDGGCRNLYASTNMPPVQVAGYGIHGFTYNVLEKDAKTNKKVDVPTSMGYRPATDLTNAIPAVTPVSYIDSWGKIQGAQTNNTAELTAAINGLKIIQERDATHATLLLDADYVRIGLLDHSKKWLANSWKKADGTEIKNIELWKQLVEIHENVLKEGRVITWLRVKGHSDDLGNDTADSNAVRGIVLGRRQLQDLSAERGTDEVLLTSEPNGYWSGKGDSNRFLSHPVTYITTMDPPTMSKDGRHVYFNGSYGKIKETDQDGKRAAGHTFSVVYLKQPDPVIEIIREQQQYVSKVMGKQNDIVRIFLNKVFSSKVYDDIKLHGTNTLQRLVSHSQDLYYIDEELVTSVAQPMLLAQRSLQYLTELDRILQEFISGNEGLVRTDITDLIYKTELVKDKEVVKLTSNVTTPSKAVKVDVGYNVTGEVKTTTLILTQVLDIPDRNTLSALAVFNPRVHVVTQRESNVAFRWAVVVEAGGEIGIWSTVHSNLKLLMESST